jgi:hypothetical protein
MPRNQLWPKNWNPLCWALGGSLIALPFWLLYSSKGHGAALAVIFAEVIFLVLYFRHSYFAWHLAFVMNIAFTVYHLAVGCHPRVDIAMGAALIAYLVVIRQPYLDYIRAYADGRI